MEELKAACIPRSYQSFDKIQPGEYPVKRFSLVETRYGNRIKVELSDVYLLLPERFNTASTEEKLAKLNSSPKMMIYSGKDLTNRNR